MRVLKSTCTSLDSCVIGPEVLLGDKDVPQKLQSFTTTPNTIEVKTQATKQQALREG